MQCAPIVQAILLNQLVTMKMDAFEVNASQEEIEYSRTVHVEEYEYLLKAKIKSLGRMLPLCTYKNRETVLKRTFNAIAPPNGNQHPSSRPYAQPHAPAIRASANPSIVESLIEDGEAVPTDEELIECRLTVVAHA